MKKILLSLNDEQERRLKSLMEEDAQTNRTAFLIGLISAETRRREESKKRPVGRPRKEDETEDPAMDENAPRTIQNPDKLDRKRTPLVNLFELEMWKEMQRRQGRSDEPEA